MIFSIENHSLHLLSISNSNSNQTSVLNPLAPEFIPHHHYHPHLPRFTNYPLFYSFPPPQPSFFNHFYCHPFYPHFPTSTTTTIYSRNEPPMLPYTTDAKPAGVDEQQLVLIDPVPMNREGEPGCVVVGESRKPKRGNNPGSSGSGSGRWVWARKDVMNHPLTLSSKYPFQDSTTLMIRNIPVRFSRKELMEVIEEHCREENDMINSSEDEPEAEPASEFDFLYLPMDFKTKGNLGYAFVNFTHWQGGARLFGSWNDTVWENCPYKTKKICQINRARFQGKHELRRHFEKSVFPCETDEYLPVEISPPRNGFNSDESILTTVGTRLQTHAH